MNVIAAGSDSTAGRKSNSYPRSDTMVSCPAMMEALTPLMASIFAAIDSSVSGDELETSTSISWRATSPVTVSVNRM